MISKVTRRRWEAEISETMNTDQVSFFAPLTWAEQRIVETPAELYDDDAPFGPPKPDPTRSAWRASNVGGIRTVAEYDLSVLIWDFQRAIGKLPPDL